MKNGNDKSIEIKARYNLNAIWACMGSHSWPTFKSDHVHLEVVEIFHSWPTLELGLHMRPRMCKV